MNKNKSINNIRKELRKNIDYKTKSTAQKYFKEKIKIYGVRVAIVTEISKEFFKEVKRLGKKEVFSLCETLLKSGYIEESFIAFKWAEYISEEFEKRDFKVLERWLETYVSNWASCDTLSNYAIGNFLLKYPKYIEKLKKWAKSKNRWVRRASAVSLVFPARKGLFLKDILEISSILLEDEDDLVQKGYGWMLRAASESYKDEVFKYVLKNKTKMPRTALRNAIGKMPEKIKRKVMEK